MPKIPNENNGRPTTKKKPKTPFQIYLESKQRTGTDFIEIGSDRIQVLDVEVRTASMVDVMVLVKGIRFLLKGWIPFGMLTMVLGPPGVGKSAFVLFGIVLSVVTGCNWFNGMEGSGIPGYVLWIDNEGGAAITSQRLNDWGIPPGRILVPFADDPLKPIDLSNPDHLARIEALINQYKIILIVIDSLRGSHKGDENSSKISEVLQNLTAIAQRTNAAIIIIHHTRKMGFDEEISPDSSRGSNAITAMVRSQLGIDKPDKDSDWCRLQMLKENLGLKPNPIGFRITSHGLEFGHSPEKPRKETVKDRADEWLRKNMVAGQWYSCKDLLDESQMEGFSETAIRRARSDLGITKPDNVRKTKSGWQWRLPEVPGEKLDQGVGQDVGENGNVLTS